VAILKRERSKIGLVEAAPFHPEQMTERVFSVIC
jgi:hypothetical protein